MPIRYLRPLLVGIVAVALSGGMAIAQESTPEPLSPLPGLHYELSGPGLLVEIEAFTIEDILPALHIEYDAALAAGSMKPVPASPQVVTYDGPPEQMQPFPGGGSNGWWLTIMIAAVPDAETVTLSVLMPVVNLPADSETFDIETIAIITTHPTSIAGPALVEGPLQTYQVVPLSGTVRPAGP